MKKYKLSNQEAAQILEDFVDEDEHQRAWREDLKA
jgi:hypothetical protein